MNIFRYLDWPMYKEARELNFLVESIVKRFPYDIKKKYSNQWNSASLSICLNIAEGAGRYSDAELCRHFDISLGSTSEVVSCADNLKHNNHISCDEFNDILKSYIWYIACLIDNICCIISKMEYFFDNSVDMRLQKGYSQPIHFSLFTTNSPQGKLINHLYNITSSVLFSINDVI